MAIIRTYNKALMNKCETYDFAKLFAKKGYAFFTKGAYNLNIIGVRASGKTVTNLFDDVIVVIYSTPDGLRRQRVYSATTDPGIRSMTNPVNSKGAAILVPNQYRGCWKIGLHKGKYSALVQIKNVQVYRDGNRDAIYDCSPTKIDNGVFGINIHKAGNATTTIDSWSAGCQVFRRADDFKSFMYLCKLQIEQGLGETFTYTLLEEEDLV